MNWQTTFAILIVFIAATWLLKQIWTVIAGVARGDRSVGSCGTCQKNPEASKATPLIQLNRTDKSE